MKEITEYRLDLISSGEPHCFRIPFSFNSLRHVRLSQMKIELLLCP